MEIWSIDISTAADRINLLCCAAGREIMALFAGGVSFQCCGRRDNMSHFVLSETKGRYK